MSTKSGKSSALRKKARKNREKCKCLKIEGHFTTDTWILWPRDYKRSPGYLAIGDYTQNPFIWLHYVESSDGTLADDDVLKSTNTRFWSIHDVQRYTLGDLHCEQVLFSCQYPDLKLPTKHGRHLWKMNTASKLPSRLYQNSQNNLQLVSLENLCCSRVEGVRLIQQLSCFNADTLKYLFLWRFVQPNENPTMVNYSYINGSGLYLSRPDTKQCFLRCLGEMQTLRVLALEYSHLADDTGAALIAILPVIKKPHFRLQLICREDQIPGRQDVGLGGGGCGIPDAAWRRVTIACPDLYLTLTLFRIREYDHARLFLTPSVPLREVHLEYGIDLEQSQRQDSDLGCFVRHLAYFYGNALVTLSIHQWRFAKFPLCKIFKFMPRLVRFHYIGEVDEKDLRDILTLVACGVCDMLKYVIIEVQDRESMAIRIQSLTEEFSQVMDLLKVHFWLSIYKN